MLELQDKNSNEERQTLFADVILPLAISKFYTYRVPFPQTDNVAVGKRVIVQFGRSKLYTAVIARIHDQAPTLYESKYLLDILDERPLITSLQLKLWDWIANYYLCNTGEVMQAALPAALKLASETKIQALQNPEVNRSELNDKEFIIMEALDIAGELKVSDVIKLLSQKTVFPIIKRLLDKGAITVSEKLQERYKPKKKAFLILNPLFSDTDSRKLLFENLSRAPKQEDALLTYIQLSRQQAKVSRQELIERSGCGATALKSLIDKEVFFVEEHIVSRLPDEEFPELNDFLLNDLQQNSLDAILRLHAHKDVVLLHGVTASGKTQVYIKLIDKVIAEGGTALYLLPEIALTSQIVERLRVYFGADVGIYHSRMSDNERAEVWQKVLNGSYKIILGARSSVFLPFKKLQLIIVDEEHEVSYKQFDPAPRYHARDTAIYLSHLYNAKVLLGSATPSIESYYNGKSGKYGMVLMGDRYGNATMPDIEVVSMGDLNKGKTQISYFSDVLVEHIKAALNRKEQIILFQNRRGYTPMLICRICGYTPKCTQCDVSLTYHKASAKLHCHYCGFKEDLIQACPACGSTHLENKGFGTERIEEELALILPEARIARLDLDSARGKDSFERIITDFGEQRFDILVGTQMVAKGLDFGKVSVIGVISADSIINYPDFRAFERSFSLLSQVSGRSGRRDVKGKVLIQAYATKHRVLEQVINHDYEGMFMVEINERKNYNYPPFHRLIKIDVKHKDQTAAYHCAERLGLALRNTFNERVLGPEIPLISRIRNYYIQTIMIKIERDGRISVPKVKEALTAIVTSFNANKANKGAYVQLDVDPY